MFFFYNLLIFFASVLLKVIALFNPKMKLFVIGRKQTFEKLEVIQPEDKTFWVHAASLGEFEQGRPIIERIKKEHPTYKIIVTFFSPSGYEIRKNNSFADVVCYLPLDSRKNVKQFIKKVNPSLAVIIKYEFWPNLLHELKRTNTKTILVSGIFREKQAFFKWYGKWMRKYLGAFYHFFVQNNISKDLLASINYTNVTISGDTRFDRVYEILQQENNLDFITEFKNNQHLLVAGSTWPDDDKLILDYIKNKASKEEKFIIAPHNIKQEEIEKLRNSITQKTILFSEKDNVNLKDFQVLIIDTIGLLTKIYAAANVAYVGGGLATGLHNILEPATFGIPVIFGGNTYHKFKEANDLLDLGGSKTVITQNDFSAIVTELKNNTEQNQKMGMICGNYVKENTGATKLVMNYINQIY